MPMSSKQKWDEHVKKQNELKRKRRTAPFYTDDEWTKVKQFVKQLRKGN
jgi:hypothetical protein